MSQGTKLLCNTNNIQFQEFRMGDLFSFSAIKQAKSQKLVPTKNDGIPYVVQSQRNNMVSRNVDADWLIKHDEAPVPGNAIVFGVTLSAVSYQPYCFGASQVIVARADFLNEGIGLYLVATINKQMRQFSYSRKPSLRAYKEMIIPLPIRLNPDGTPTIDSSHRYSLQGYIPDWDYMDTYIRKLEVEQIKILDQYLVETGLNNCELTDKEKKALSSDSSLSKDMIKFRMGDLFTFETGDVDLQQKDITGKGCYFINSGQTDCGVKGLTDKKARTFPANTITVDFWGNAFYRDFEYKLATHNHVFSLSGDIIKSREVGLYLVSQMSYFRKLFSYSNMGTIKKISGLFIYLPIQTNAKGEAILDSEKKFHPDGFIPDWDFMTNYIRAIEKRIIEDVVSYQNNLIAEV